MDISTPADLVAGQTFERISEGVQTIERGRRAGGVTIFALTEASFDPLSQRLVDPAAIQRPDAGPGTTAFRFDSDWWSVMDAGEVERRLGQLPDAVVDAVRAEVVGTIDAAHRRWQGALAANGSADAARLEGYGPPNEDAAATHAYSVLQVVDTELESRR